MSGIPKGLSTGPNGRHQTGVKTGRVPVRLHRRRFYLYAQSQAKMKV